MACWMGNILFQLGASTASRATVCLTCFYQRIAGNSWRVVDWRGHWPHYTQISPGPTERPWDEVCKAPFTPRPSRYSLPWRNGRQTRWRTGWYNGSVSPHQSYWPATWPDIRQQNYLPNQLTKPLSICLSMALQSFSWNLAAFSLSYSYTQLVGLLGRGIGQSQGRYLHTEQHKHRINAHKHQCFEWDWNPRCQISSERRQFMS
jgi:hypothetical protein